MVSLNIDDKDSIKVAFNKIETAFTDLSNLIEEKGIDTSSFATKSDLWIEKGRIDEILKYNKSISSCIGGINDSISSINSFIVSLNESDDKIKTNVDDIYKQLQIINSSIISQNNLITEINTKLNI